MEIQELLVVITFAIAVIFLVKKFGIKPKTKKDKTACNSGDCGCH